MASSHGTPPVFNNKVIAWVDHRLPIFSYIEKEYHTFPTPRNFNYFWNFGAIATVMLVLMIATGIVLATNYTAHVMMAFDSVERIDRGSGWLCRRPVGECDRAHDDGKGEQPRQRVGGAQGARARLALLG